MGADTDREDVSGGSKLCQLAVWFVRSGIGAATYCSGTGIEPLLGLRANSEPCNRVGPFGDQRAGSSGRPVVASTKRWNCEGSTNESVEESQVCGLGLLDPLPRAVGLTTVTSGDVRARVGGVSKNVSVELTWEVYSCVAE